MKITKMFEVAKAISENSGDIKSLLQLSKKPVAELSAELFPEVKKAG